MKVTALETIELAEFPFMFWLRVHTDEGLIGTGETFWQAFQASNQKQLRSGE